MDAVETGAFANTPAWHHKGNVVDTNGEKGMTVPQTLKKSGLDWIVQKVPAVALALGKEPQDREDFMRLQAGTKRLDYNDLRLIEGRYNVQRQSDGEVLGVVGEVWQPVQNHEGFALIEDFMQGNTAWIEAAGALDGGRQVWILAHMAEDLFIAGEQVVPYVLFTNGHNGRTSVTAAMTDVRVVCQNTLTFALARCPRKVSVRHTVKATARLAEAKRILGLRDLYSEELAKQGEWLATHKISTKAFDMFLESLMPVPDEQEGKPAETMILSRRDQVRDLYMNADNLNNIRGSRWGALQAVVEYADYGRAFASDETQMKAQFSHTPLKDTARELLLPSKK